MPDNVLGAKANTLIKTKFLSSGSLHSSRRQNIMNKNMDVRSVENVLKGQSNLAGDMTQVQVT